MQTPLLSCHALRFSYPQQKVLDNIELSCHSGEFVGLIGANGAGKSTLLKLLMGLEQADSGKVILNAQPLSRYTRRDIAKSVSLVPQDLSINYAFSAREVVAMGRNPYLGSYQTESAQDLEIIEQALQRSDLQQLADRRVDQLSGGERQRVFIARALAQQAKILLLDEPTASLDLCHQYDLMQLIRELTREDHLAIAAIHDLQLAARFCDRLIMLYQGSIVADGTPEEVLTEDNLLRYFAIKAEVSRDQATHQIRINVLHSGAVSA